MTDRGAVRTAARCAAVALVALIGTGCANAPAGDPNPATGGGPDSALNSNAPAEAGRGGDENVAAEVRPDPGRRERSLELSKCMRENGVEDFPDPDADGVILYYGDSPQLTSAGEKCRHLRPVPEGQYPGNGG